MTEIQTHTKWGCPVTLVLDFEGQIVRAYDYFNDLDLGDVNIPVVELLVAA